MAGPGGKEVGRISIRVVPDTSKTRSQLKRDLKKVVAGLKIKIPVVLDGLAKAEAALDALARNRKVKLEVDVDRDIDLPSLSKEKLDVKVDVDSSEVQRFVAYVKSLRPTIHVDVDVDRRSMANLDRQLASRRMKVDVDIDTSNVKNVDRDLNVARNGFRGLSNSIGDASSNMQGLSGHTKAMIALVLALAPVLTGVIATFIAGIPALISAFGAAATTIALGMDGIKKAFEALTPALDKLKSRVSAVFERQLAPIVQSLIPMIDRLTPSFETMAGSLVTMASGFTKVITSAQGMAVIEQIMSKTSQLFENLGPTIATLTGGFLTLSNVAADSFGSLHSVFNVFATEFNKFANEMANSPALANAFTGLEHALNGLTVGFFDLMRAGITTMGTLGPAIGRFFMSFGELSKGLIPILGSLMQIVLDLASAFMSAFAPVLQRMAPIIQRVADMFSRFISQVFERVDFAGLIEKTAQSFTKLLDAVEPLIPMVADFVAQWIEMMAQVGADWFAAIIESVALLAEEFAKLMPVIAPLVPELVKLGTELLKLILNPELIQMMTQFLRMAMQAALVTGPMFIMAMKFLIQVLTFLAGVFRGLLSPMTNFRSAMERIGNIARTVSDAYEGLKQKFVDLVTTGLNKFEELKNGINEKLEAAKNWVQEKVDAIKTIFANVDLFSIGAAIIDGLSAGMLSKMGDVMAKAQSIANNIKAAFTSVGGFNINSPSKKMIPVGSSVIEGIEVGMDKRQDKLMQKPKTIAEKFTAAAEDAFKDVPKTIGQSWMDSLMGDLGFSSSGAFGSLIGQLIDPQVRWEEEQNVYVVKDLDEAERSSEKKKKKKSLQYTGPHMGRSV